MQKAGGSCFRPFFVFGEHSDGTFPELLAKDCLRGSVLFVLKIFGLLLTIILRAVDHR